MKSKVVVTLTADVREQLQAKFFEIDCEDALQKGQAPVNVELPTSISSHMGLRGIVVNLECVYSSERERYLCPPEIGFSARSQGQFFLAGELKDKANWMLSVDRKSHKVIGNLKDPSHLERLIEIFKAAKVVEVLCLPGQGPDAFHLRLDHPLVGQKIQRMMDYTCIKNEFEPKLLTDYQIV